MDNKPFFVTVHNEKQGRVCIGNIEHQTDAVNKVEKYIRIKYSQTNDDIEKDQGSLKTLMSCLFMNRSGVSHKLGKRECEHGWENPEGRRV